MILAIDVGNTNIGLGLIEDGEIRNILRIHTDPRETGTEYVIAKDGKPGPWSIKMREILMGIQYGEIEDKHHWCTLIDC